MNNPRFTNQLSFSVALCVGLLILMTPEIPAQQTVPITNTLLDKHYYDESASYCAGNNILFYNGQTGSGMAGKMDRNGFQVTQSFDAGKFATGWTHVANVEFMSSILFYNASTGDAALGTLDHGIFSTTKTYNNLSHGWTNILYVGLNNNHALFYNSVTGGAVLGFAPTTRTYKKGDFPPEWTHIVWNNAGTLFYDTYKGSGAITEPMVAPGTPGPFAPLNDLKTTRSFDNGAFTTQWSHVVATQSHVLFYNRTDGSAAIGTLSSSNFDTRKKYERGKLSAEWTHVVSTGDDNLFFYNSLTGSAAIAKIVGDELQTTKTLGPDSFARGYTLVICSADAPPQPH